MIIKSLEIKNFQVLKDFSGNFEGGLFFITGDNELGKSTLLKAIVCCLTGERDAVLSNGEDKGFTKMIVGDDNQEYEVKLSYTKANPRGKITITGKDGMKSDNISMLQKIFAYKNFDAVEFSRWSETAEGRRKQIDVVRALLPKEVQEQIDKIDKDIIKIKDSRKEDNVLLRGQNSFVEQSEKELQGIDIKRYEKNIPIEDLMQKQKTEAELVQKSKGVAEKIALRTSQLAEIPALVQIANDTFEDEKAFVERLKITAKEDYDRAIESLNNRLSIAEKKQKTDLETLEKNKKDYTEKLASATEWMEKYNAENPEGNSVEEKVKQAAEHNKIHEKVVSYKSILKTRNDIEKRVKDFDTSLEKKLEDRAELIKKSNLPIEGLTFNDEGLELNGVPFVEGKVSDSQIMEVAAKLIIASNKNVNIFCIARGESLGKKRLESLIKLAKDNGYQGFIEEVKRGQDEIAIEEYTEG